MYKNSLPQINNLWDFFSKGKSISGMVQDTDSIDKNGIKYKICLY